MKDFYETCIEYIVQYIVLGRKDGGSFVVQKRTLDGNVGMLFVASTCPSVQTGSDTSSYHYQHTMPYHSFIHWDDHICSFVLSFLMCQSHLHNAPLIKRYTFAQPFCCLDKIQLYLLFINFLLIHTKLKKGKKNYN